MSRGKPCIYLKMIMGFKCQNRRSTKTTGISQLFFLRQKVHVVTEVEPDREPADGRMALEEAERCFPNAKVLLAREHLHDVFRCESLADAADLYHFEAALIKDHPEACAVEVEDMLRRHQKMPSRAPDLGEPTAGIGGVDGQ
jgi:hypothetical protein